MTTTTKTAGGEGQAAQKCIVQLYNRNVFYNKILVYYTNIQWPIFMCL